jgi:hypothetical protein
MEGCRCSPDHRRITFGDRRANVLRYSSITSKIPSTGRNHATGPNDSSHLRSHLARFREEVDHVSGNRSVESLVVKRKGQRIVPPEMDSIVLVSCAGIRELRVCNVDDHVLAWRTALNNDLAESSGAAAHIKPATVGWDSQPSNEAATADATPSSIKALVSLRIEICWRNIRTCHSTHSSAEHELDPIRYN